MKKYIIDLKMPDVKNAGPKARNDVNYFLSDAGYKLVRLHYPVTYRKFITPLILLPYTFVYFFKLICLFQKNDTILIQFPIPDVYINLFSAIKRIKKIKLIILIHDLEHFRKGRSIEEDLVYFKDADVIISHNAAMTRMIKRPYLTPNIIDLSVFDYRVITEQKINDAFDENKANLVINYAGNLAPDKSGFVYKVPSLHLPYNIRMSIFGINYKNTTDESISYGGAFSPDDPSALKGDFGLVWDGNSLESCEGLFGTYLKINNPHKLSLYLSVSKPVIVWSEAAVATFILEKKVGVTVNSLKEIEAKLESLSASEKLFLKNNAREYGKKVREGYFIKTAVAKAEKL